MTETSTVNERTSRRREVSRMDLGGGYMLEPDKGGCRVILLYRGQEIGRPFCVGYALRVINQHRPPTPST